MSQNIMLPFLLSSTRNFVVFFCLILPKESDSDDCETIKEMVVK